MRNAYMERAKQIACEATIAVQVCLSRDNADVDFIPLRPRLADESELLSREEFARRQLRPVGVLGLVGAKPLCAFREPLEPRVIDALAQSFFEYVRVLLGTEFEAQIEAAEIAELQRMYGLSDPRAN